ncbi:MAG: T9SS type A sorting domain-containing protein [Flavobacteriales bacterium]|nr:T9SS type A sorting domain-containing protein [Flavobacteriales bacterium]
MKITTYALLVIALSAGAPPVYAQVDCLGVLGGTALPGTPCDDNDPTTSDDIWYPQCSCQGVCDPVGPACDDFNPYTGNDWMTTCGCFGYCDTWPCDDGNPYTTGDQYWPQWCFCEGYCTDPVGSPCNDGDPLTIGEFLNGYCECVGGSNMISGQVFLDLDLDGVFSAGDQPLPNRTIQVGPGYRYTVSDQAGDFYIIVPSGSYALTVYPGSFDVQALAPPVVSVIGQGLISNGHALAMNATSLEPDLAIYGCLSQPSPGFPSTTYQYVRNLGTTPTDGSMTLTYDNQLTYLGATGAPSVVANTVTWGVPILQPGEYHLEKAHYQTPIGTPLGTPLTQVSTVLTNPPDNVPGNDQRTWNGIVTGSFDPNDKQVTPSVLTPQDVDDGTRVEYMIRFQNTGTAPAQNVRITDELPQQVNASTFEFIGSSHPCHINFQYGVLEFLFDGIMLPDSNASEPDSHGFVLFSIKPMSTLLAGDSVWNRAYIYFDFNEPVITNAATFRVETSTMVQEVEAGGMTVWPNPAMDVLQVAANTSQPVDLIIVDLSGRVVRRMEEAAANGVLTVPLADLPDGLYTVRISSNGRTSNERFVKMR